MSLKKAIIIGASSDIGSALCDDWNLKNWELVGTYRTKPDKFLHLSKILRPLVQCDLESKSSIDKAYNKLNRSIINWDVLVFGPGLLDPIDLFNKCNFDVWEKSITVNFTNQLRLLHLLLPHRKKQSLDGPTVLFFAGGGVNDAPTHYSAYTVSKIAMIKMVELLATEMPDVKFIIIGPGWVKTKIHESTLNAKDLAGLNYERTLQKLKDDTFTPMKKVVECCNVLIAESREIFSGRNFSVAFDDWDNPNFKDLLKNPNTYKLRRYKD